MNNRIFHSQAAVTRSAPATLIGAGAMLISGALAACSSPEAAGTWSAAPPVVVAAVPAMMSDVATSIDAGGVVQARTTAAITARLLAPIREVRVVPGDRVRKGQTLIVLDASDLNAAARAASASSVAAEQASNAAAAELQAAEAAVVLARASYERIAGLHVRGSATTQERDEATASLRNGEARVVAASARVRQAASALEGARATSAQAAATESFATIAAPFDGMVTETIAEPGNMASPGTVLARLEDTGEFRLEVRVDESRVAAIDGGASVPVFLGLGTSPVEGRVVEVSRAVDADARAFVVKIALPHVPGLRSGAFGKARLHASPRRALTIPPAALMRRGQLTSVFVADDGKARLRLVDVRDSEVVAGLSESELVIVSPAGLVDGQPVRLGGR